MVEPQLRKMSRQLVPGLCADRPITHCGVLVCVALAVRDGVRLGVTVLEGVTAAVAVLERVTAAVLLGVLVSAGVGVREEVAVWVPVRDGVEVCVELPVLVLVAEEDGVAE